MEKGAAGSPQGHTNPGMSRDLASRLPYCPSGSEGRGWGRPHLLVCSFPASSPYWRQRREESCSPPEAPTSRVRLLPPARAEGIGTSCGPDRSSQGSPGPRSSGGDSRRPRRRTSPGSLPVSSSRRSPVSTPAPLDRIGVGIDTARYGHRVSFLRPDRQPAAKPLTVMEDRAGYQALQERLKQLQERHPEAHFHVRIDAAGQYAANLEQFLRGLELPMTISVGEPKRHKDYQKAHFPERTTDDTESQAMARFAVVEQPDATPAPLVPMVLLRDVAGRLQAQVKQTTQAVNRLHNLLARTFPELATLTDDIAVAWALRLLQMYPTAERIAAAHLASLEKIPHLSREQAQALHQAAQRSVASVRGDLAEALVRDLVGQVQHCQKAERHLRQLLVAAFSDLPASPHVQILTIPGIGEATAAALVAKIVDIDRFATPNHLVNYLGVFPEESSSGVDKRGKPLP